MAERAVVFGGLEVVRMTVVVSLVGFVGSVRMRVRGGGSRNHRLAADVKSPLAGERGVWRAVVLSAEGVVCVGVFGAERVGGLGTDGDPGTGEFLAEGCFGVGEGRGRDVQNPVAGEM